MSSIDWYPTWPEWMYVTGVMVTIVRMVRMVEKKVSIFFIFFAFIVNLSWKNDSCKKITVQGLFIEIWRSNGTYWQKIKCGIFQFFLAFRINRPWKKRIWQKKLWFDPYSSRYGGSHSQKKYFSFFFGYFGFWPQKKWIRLHKFILRFLFFD